MNHERRYKMSIIGNRIKKRRKELNLSADELGHKIGKDRATIYRYENNDIAKLPSTILEPLASALDTTPAFLMGWDNSTPDTQSTSGNTSPAKGIRIPVLGRVAAGIPIEAITNIEDWEEIPQSMAKTGEYFALKIAGKSMEPRMMDGDVVIVRRQPDVDSGDIAVVLVNGNDATVKQISKSDAGLTLIGWNPSVYIPKTYNKKECQELPVTILGKVVEIRGKL